MRRFEKKTVIREYPVEDFGINIIRNDSSETTLHV